MIIFVAMQFREISLTQFKNYTAASFAINEKIVGIVGPNGVGKTNLLDAIYYLSFTKSYFAKSDNNNVQHGKEGFRISASGLMAGEQQSIHIVLRETGKKELTVNNEPIAKMAQHIGQMPAIMIAPDDLAIINGNSEERRKFIDTVISQIDAEYLAALIKYNKILTQRNGLLKQFAEQGQTNKDLLDVYDVQLISNGDIVFQKRVHWLKKLLNITGQQYAAIAGETTKENMALQYFSQLHTTPFAQLLKDNQQKDGLLQRTNGGVHKDDLVFTLHDEPFKQTASQGQKKSLLFALKIAAFQLIEAATGKTPILLLDDIFEKLDEERMNHLLSIVCQQNNGMVFITDTHQERLTIQLEKTGKPYQIIALTN
jgi:DNA replication and repair protein RecF